MDGKPERPPLEEIAARGKKLIKEKLTDEEVERHRGRVVSVDIYTGDVEIGDGALETTKANLSRQPNAEIFTSRVGMRAYASFGGCSLLEER